MVQHISHKIDQFVGYQRTTRWIKRCALFFLLFCAFLSTSRLWGQSGAGTIQGTVHDSTGAVVSNASITVVQVASGQQIHASSNKVGFFIVPSLFTGEYNISIDAPGMTRWVGTISVQVTQIAVINPILSIATVQQKVTVGGDVTSLVNYEDSTISTTLENKRINELPMNGRNIQTLVNETTPGVEPNGRVNGNEDAAFEYVQDGAVLADLDQGGDAVVPMTPDPDSIQEVTVVTSNSSAQYNRPATAVITTKSGTNDLHGALFETARNNAIGVANSRGSGTTSAPKLIRNEFGGSLGGPIVFPKLYNGRSKSFFFGSYERRSIAQGTPLDLYVPTLAMRQGNFGGLTTSTGIPYKIYDNLTSNPLTAQRQAFPGNQIPASRISPLASAIYALTPAPTTADSPLIAPNWVAPVVNNSTIYTITTRLDQHINETNMAYLTFTHSNQTSLGIQGYSGNSPYYGPPSPQNGAINLAGEPIHVDAAALSYSHTFSPTFYSTTVLSQTWYYDLNGAVGNQNVPWSTQLGLPNNFNQISFPQIIGTADGASQNSIFMNTAPGTYRSDSQIITNLDENLIKIIGKHQLQFGGRYRHERIGIFPDQNPANETQFSGAATGLELESSGTEYGQTPYTGLAAADFYLGNAQAYTVNLNQGYYHFRNQEIDSYFQDDYHINNRLVLNLGLRWEIHPALHEKHNYLSAFDVTNKAIVLGQSLDNLYKLGVTTPPIIASLENLGVKFENAQQANLPSSLIQGNPWTFAPRFGAAYRLFGINHTTVLRGGYGTYIYPPPVRNFYAVQRTDAPFSEVYTQSYTNAAQSPDGGANYILRAPQTVVAGKNSSDIVATTGTQAFVPGLTFYSLNPHYPVTYVQQFNVTLEQQVAPNAALRFTYLLDHGSNLEQYNYINAGPSAYVWYARTGTPLAGGYYASVAQNPYDHVTYGGIDIQQKTGYSNDNSGQVAYQRLFNRGYAFQVFYVFSSAQRNGGNGFRDSFIYPLTDFAPGAASFNTLSEENRKINYRTDNAIPRHRVRWNFVVDLPVGRGKLLLGKSNRFVDEIVGGWQVASDGTLFSQSFQLETTNWGPITPTHLYKHKYPIQDCRSGVCYKSYLYYNGYIAPSLINSPKGVEGIPANYVPNQTPLVTDPTSPYYLTNTVQVTLNNGSKATTTYSPGPGLHPYNNTFIEGPFNWTEDASLYKVFPIKGAVQMKVNLDVFNVFNEQGYISPDSTTGIESLRSSYNTPRQIQITARLNW